MPHIYKITSPKKKVYVGSTININKRFNSYKNLKCKTQIKIYRSLFKYGVENHKFEIITECSIDEMYKLECYYGNIYNVLSDNGLNLRLPKEDENFKCESKETSLKRSKLMKGNKYRLGHKPWNTGIKCDEKTRERLSKYRNGTKLTDEQKLKQKEAIKKVRSTPESRLKTSIASKGGNNGYAKKVIRLTDGFIFGSVSEAAESVNMNSHTLGHYLRGRFKNTTNFKFA